MEINDSLLQELEDIAKEAGYTAMNMKENINETTKENNTPLTEADKKTEKIIRKKLENKTDYPVIGEEFGGDYNEKNSWIVDPIDGTKNYASGQPFYGTAIALVNKYDGPKLALFYMPELDNLYYAKENKGSYMNNSKISISKEKPTEKAYYVLSGKGRNTITEEVSKYNEWIQQLGCALMSEALVASGQSDIGIFCALAPWDMAVGKLLVEEAGGVMKNINSESKRWDEVKNGKCIFGNEKTVNKVLDNMNDKLKKKIGKTTYNY